MTIELAKHPHTFEPIILIRSECGRVYRLTGDSSALFERLWRRQ